LGESPPIRQQIKLLPTKSKKDIAKFAIATTVFGFGAGLIISLLPLWFYLRFGVGGSELGPMFVITNGLMAASYLIAPELSRRFGPVRSIVSTQLLSTIFLLAMPIFPLYNVVAIIYVLRSFLMNISVPIQSAFMMDVVYPNERALASSISAPSSGVAWGISFSISQGIGGFMLEQHMLELPFYICSIMYILGAILFFVFFHFQSSAGISGTQTSRP